MRNGIHDDDIDDAEGIVVDEDDVLETETELPMLSGIFC